MSLLSKISPEMCMIQRFQNITLKLVLFWYILFFLQMSESHCTTNSSSNQHHILPDVRIIFRIFLVYAKFLYHDKTLTSKLTKTEYFKSLRLCFIISTTVCRLLSNQIGFEWNIFSFWKCRQYFREFYFTFIFYSINFSFKVYVIMLFN